MPTVYFITHPDVLIDPSVPVPEWCLSPRGRVRMAKALAQPWAGSLRKVWCSTERKARDGAKILAEGLGLSVTELDALGENDRSATGYLTPTAFDATVGTFFATPERSVHGWERAVDAQSRIVTAIDWLLSKGTDGGAVAIVSHGGVGTLLLCHLLRSQISRTHDQPANNGGNYYAFDVESRYVHHCWTPIDS